MRVLLRAPRALACAWATACPNRCGRSVASPSLRTTTVHRNVNMQAHDNNDKVKDELPPLVLMGDRELMTPCPPLASLDEMNHHDRQELAQHIQTLKQCQKAYGGIGIAACQVGWRTRIFCMGIEEDDTAARDRYPDAPPFPFQVWINPTLTPILGDNNDNTNWFWEGCLSVPGMRGWVERPKAIQIHGWDERGQEHNMTLDGLAARVAQHEHDHLDGILFPQRAVPGTLVPVPAFASQEHWLDDWPTAGARRTTPGGFSEEA